MVSYLKGFVWSSQALDFRDAGYVLLTEDNVGILDFLLNDICAIECAFDDVDIGVSSGNVLPLLITANKGSDLPFRMSFRDNMEEIPANVASSASTKSRLVGNRAHDVGVQCFSTYKKILGAIVYLILREQFASVLSKWLDV